MRGFVKTSLFFLLAVMPLFSAGQSLTAERKAQLEQELANLESQIEAQKKILESKQRESVSLERDISILTAKIERAKLNIKARTIAITKLNDNIADKGKTINLLDDKIGREKQSLSSIIKKVNEFESFSIAEIILDNRSLSEFFSDLDSYNQIQIALRDSFEEIRGDRTKTESEKSDLEEKRQEELELKALQELEKKRVEEQEAEKRSILKISKGLEAEYQKLIQTKQSDAQKIRTELFGLRGSAAIPFERAVELANKAFIKTGVRAAFLLGIIAEESNLGANVGTGSWRVDMKAPRDTEPFLDITRRLGLDPDKMPVSKKAWYGYGGAMGPAQFIPSTWILYEERIAEATGHNPPNPWDPEDAFMAAAIYLEDSGAAKKTVAAERYAALCYLAGCANAGKKAYQFYADDVMDLADKYQKQMNILSGS